MAEARKRMKLDDGLPSGVDAQASFATFISRLAAALGASSGEVAAKDATGGADPVALLKAVLASRPKLEAGVREKIDGALGVLTERLETTAGRLQTLLEHHTPSTVPDFCRQEPSVDYAHQIVTYAHKLSFTTFAPPGWAPGRPLGRFRPPAPQDWQLRASLLHQFARQQESARAELPAVVEGPLAIAPGQPLAKPPAPAVIPELPPMPPGWKPGDPLPDLPDLPPMPAGWKPGDELPGIAEIGTPAKALKEAPPKAAKQATVPPAPEGVRSAFDFLLNPDLQEVEEDYSSDEYTDDDE